jgi:hypothetical protein
MSKKEEVEEYITIIGFASLLSYDSAKSSFPNLINFRKGKIKNYRRIFSHHAYIFYERNVVKNNEASGCAVEFSENSIIFVIVFEIPKKELDNFYKREEQFNFINVLPLNMDDSKMDNEGIMCIKSTDEELKKKLGDDLFLKFKKYNVSKIWDDKNILPCRAYLRLCVLASMSLGKEFFENFINSSYLVDRKTTIKEYLLKNKDIMYELPPKELEKKYNIENYEEILKKFEYFFE